VRAGRELIESGRFADRDLSELASALSTLEYQAGNEKRARRLLRLGLRDPSDNTLAQAQWLSAQLGFDVPELDLGIKGNALSFEARALETFRRGQWGQSLSSARSWLGDQPFSSRPAIHGSYVASVALEDYDATEELARAGLEANQFDPTLLNNLAYALIQKGKLEEAASEFKKAQRSARRPEERIALLATAGLYALRNGAVDEGRTLYRHAIEISEAAGLKRYAAHAAINLATESIRSHLGSVFEDVLFAEGAAESVQDADIQVLLTRLRARKQAFRLA
jgi:tetratricopeptide (TPR) repeat protein